MVGERAVYSLNADVAAVDRPRTADVLNGRAPRTLDVLSARGPASHSGCPQWPWVGLTQRMSLVAVGRPRTADVLACAGHGQLQRAPVVVVEAATSRQRERIVADSYVNRIRPTYPRVTNHRLADQSQNKHFQVQALPLVILTTSLLYPLL